MKSITTFSILMGWIGTLSYIAGYIFLSLGKLKAEHKTYHLLNILGAVGLIINAVYLSDYPNVIVNLVWLAIAAMALVLIFKRKKRGL